MTEPLVRITCPVHPGRSIGYIHVAPPWADWHFICQTQVPVSPEEHRGRMDRYSQAKQQGRSIPRALVGSTVLSLPLDDDHDRGGIGGLPAWCPDCRAERFLEFAWLRKLVLEPRSVVSANDVLGSAQQKTPRRGAPMAEGHRHRGDVGAFVFVTRAAIAPGLPRRP